MMINYEKFVKDCKNGNYESVKEQLEQLNHEKISLKEVVNYNHQLYGSPLYQASTSGSPELVQLLIDYGADVNFSHAIYDTPLYVACELHRFEGDDIAHETVRILLDHGANIDGKHDSTINSDPYKTRPIEIAFHVQNKKTVELLLERGADIHYNADQDVPLIVKLIERYLYLIDPLSDQGWHYSISELEPFFIHGADANYRNKDNVSVLSLALEKQNSDLMQLLLNYGAKRNANPKVEATYVGEIITNDRPSLTTLIYYGFAFTQEEISEIQDSKYSKKHPYLSFELCQSDGYYYEQKAYKILSIMNGENLCDFKTAQAVYEASNLGNLAILPSQILPKILSNISLQDLNAFTVACSGNPRNDINLLRQLVCLDPLLDAKNITLGYTGLRVKKELIKFLNHRKEHVTAHINRLDFFIERGKWPETDPEKKKSNGSDNYEFIMQYKAALIDNTPMGILMAKVTLFVTYMRLGGGSFYLQQAQKVQHQQVNVPPQSLQLYFHGAGMLGDSIKAKLSEVSAFDTVEKFLKPIRLSPLLYLVVNKQGYPSFSDGKLSVSKAIEIAQNCLWMIDALIQNLQSGPIYQYDEDFEPDNTETPSMRTNGKC